MFEDRLVAGVSGSIFGLKQLYGLRLALVEGPSMSPTLNPHLATLPAEKPPSYQFNDVVLIQSVDSDDLSVGPIVCLRHPKLSGAFIIKRLSRLYPDSTCWVTSDAGERKFLDSSILGPLPNESIVGRATHIVFPPSRVRRL